MFRKFLKATALVLTLVSMFIIAKPVQADAASTYVTTTARLRVRSGASTKYRVKGTLSKGKKVRVVSSKSGWYKVKYGSSYGWIKKSYTKKSSSSSKSYSSSGRKITVRAYAYTGGGRTATGTKARYGVIAVDPRVIPYGTKVYIKELGGTFRAEDCGGGIKGNKIDIYMNSSAACNRWGVRKITLQIVK